VPADLGQRQAEMAPCVGPGLVGNAVGGGAIGRVVDAAGDGVGGDAFGAVMGRI